MRMESVRDWRERSNGPERRSGGREPNFGSARSDYGDRAYGGRLNKQGMERDWWDRTTDEVGSWFGDDDAERRREMDEYRSGDRDDSYGRGRGGRRGRSHGRTRGWSGIRARDVMTRDVTTVHPDDPVRYAARMMGECDCGAVPVVDDNGRMIGMITDRDIAIRVVANGEDPQRTRVSDCMTHETFSCDADSDISECMETMSDHQIRRMPIVDGRGRVVGIVSQADLAQHAADSRRGARVSVSNMVDAISEPTSGSYS